MTTTPEALPGTLSAIPVARIKPLVDRWALASGRSEDGYRWLLAHRSGVSLKKLSSILDEKVETVRFRTVDKILSGIERPDAWHVELADLYEEAS